MELEELSETNVSLNEEGTETVQDESDEKDKEKDSASNVLKSNPNYDKGKGPTWEGQRLYPPSRKSSKPSKAWKFGGKMNK